MLERLLVEIEKIGMRFAPEFFPSSPAKGKAILQKLPNSPMPPVQSHDTTPVWEVYNPGEPGIVMVAKFAQDTSSKEMAFLLEKALLNTCIETGVELKSLGGQFKIVDSQRILVTVRNRVEPAQEDLASSMYTLARELSTHGLISSVALSSGDIANVKGPTGSTEVSQAVTEAFRMIDIPPQPTASHQPGALKIVCSEGFEGIFLTKDPSHVIKQKVDLKGLGPKTVYVHRGKLPQPPSVSASVFVTGGLELAARKNSTRADIILKDVGVYIPEGSRSDLEEQLTARLKNEGVEAAVTVLKLDIRGSTGIQKFLDQISPQIYREQIIEPFFAHLNVAIENAHKLTKYPIPVMFFKCDGDGVDIVVPQDKSSQGLVDFLVCFAQEMRNFVLQGKTQIANNVKRTFDLPPNDISAIMNADLRTVIVTPNDSKIKLTLSNVAGQPQLTFTGESMNLARKTEEKMKDDPSRDIVICRSLKGEPERLDANFSPARKRLSNLTSPRSEFSYRIETPPKANVSTSYMRRSNFVH